MLPSYGRDDLGPEAGLADADFEHLGRCCLGMQRDGEIAADGALPRTFLTIAPDGTPTVDHDEVLAFTVARSSH